MTNARAGDYALLVTASGKKIAVDMGNPPVVGDHVAIVPLDGGKTIAIKCGTPSVGQKTLLKKNAPIPLPITLSPQIWDIHSIPYWNWSPEVWDDDFGYSPQYTLANYPDPPWYTMIDQVDDDYLGITPPAGFSSYHVWGFYYISTTGAWPTGRLTGKVGTFTHIDFLMYLQPRDGHNSSQIAIGYYENSGADYTDIYSTVFGDGNGFDWMRISYDAPAPVKDAYLRIHYFTNSTKYENQIGLCDMHIY